MDLDNISEVVRKAEILVDQLSTISDANVTFRHLFDLSVWRPVLNQLTNLSMTTDSTVQ